MAKMVLKEPVKDLLCFDINIYQDYTTAHCLVHLWKREGALSFLEFFIQAYEPSSRSWVVSAEFVVYAKMNGDDRAGFWCRVDCT